MKPTEGPRIYFHPTETSRLFLGSFFCLFLGLSVIKVRNWGYFLHHFRGDFDQGKITGPAFLIRLFLFLFFLFFFLRLRAGFGGEAGLMLTRLKSEQDWASAAMLH